MQNERPTACPPSPIPSDLSSSCLSQANLAILNHVPAALLENYGSVMQGIASDIQLLLPELESFTGVSASITTLVISKQLLSSLPFSIIRSRDLSVL